MVHSNKDNIQYIIISSENLEKIINNIEDNIKRINNDIIVSMDNINKLDNIINSRLDKISITIDSITSKEYVEYNHYNTAIFNIKDQIYIIENTIESLKKNYKKK